VYKIIRLKRGFRRTQRTYGT